MEEEIRIPYGNFEVTREQGEYFRTGIQSIVALQEKIGSGLAMTLLLHCKT